MKSLVIFNALKNIKGEPTINTAEVGVYRGGTSLFIAETLKELNLCLQWNHYGFDTFEGHSAKDISKSDTHKQSQFDGASFENARAMLAHFPNVTLYKGRFQDTSALIRGKRFHFVHLDVDLYKPTLYALEFFGKRMARNGIIVVDDYGHVSCPGVRKAVDGFLLANGRFISFPLLTGQMLVVKR